MNNKNEFSVSYEGTTFKVEFKAFSKTRRYNGNRRMYHAIITQCIITSDERIIGLGEAVKCEGDKDNYKYARVYAAKKAFAQTRLWKSIRAKLWKQILKG